MKESQAVELYCPFKFSGALAANRPAIPACEGSACMMWVMTYRPSKDNNFTGEREGYCAFRNTMYSMDER